MKRKNKKGWIKVIEAFLAIAMFGGALFLLIQSDLIRSDPKIAIEERETDLLLGVQLNNSLRLEVLSATNFSATSNDTSFSTPLIEYMNNSKVIGATCYLKICPIIDDCLIDFETDEVYAKDILITSTSNIYDPRRLKIFCVQEK